MHSAEIIGFFLKNFTINTLQISMMQSNFKSYKVLFALLCDARKYIQNVDNTQVYIPIVGK